MGLKNKRILENGHNKITTWGIGTEYDKETWFELVELLIDQGYLIKYGEYNILQLTPQGKAFLSSRTELNLPLNPLNMTHPISFAKTSSKGNKIIAEKPAANDQVAERILTQLKAWRKRKADDLNIAPYMIFGDKTLLDLAAKKPKSKTDLLNVYGIGKAKSEEFGRSILQIISEIE